MAKLTFKRCEKKFLITPEQYALLVDVMKNNNMVYDEYCCGGSVYPIYNIYFDDDENSVIRRSIQHPKFKQKLRLRSYTIPKTGSEDVFLEIKRKINGVVVKRRVTLGYDEAMDFVRFNQRPLTDDYLKNRIIDEIGYYLSVNRVKPTVFLSYERIAFFENGNSEFRVTFDKNIVSRRYDLDFRLGSYGEKLLHDDEILMEVKIPGAIPKWFSDVLSHEKIYISGFSKYGNEYARYRGREFLHICERSRTASGADNK